MKKEFTYVSAFAGIGGMTLGLKDLGGKGLMAWEYDPTEKRTQYAQDAHKLLHPEITVYGDIHEAKPEELPDFDVLCFTPPCQAFSVAGKRGGFDDTRGTLTFEALRIAKAKQPKLLFMENVKGLVNHDAGNTMSTIIHAINEIGYTIDYNVINSKYFDVAQNRERVYLIAIRDDLIAPEPWADTKGTTMLPKSKLRYQEEGAKTFNFDWPEQAEVRTRLRDFLEDNVDEKYYLSEDKTAKLVAQLDQMANVPTGPFIADGKNSYGNGYKLYTQGIAPTCLSNDYKEPKKVVEKYVGGLNTTADEQSYCITTRIAGETLPKHLVGNQGCLIEEIEGLPIREATTVGPRYRIRKLTPKECLRLQSVPDWAIDILLENFSDSRVYKFAGNGLTTNVIKAIGEKLLKYL